MTRQNQNTPTTPSQADIDAAVARGKRLRSKAFIEFFASIAAAFTGASPRPTDQAYGNGAR